MNGVRNSLHTFNDVILVDALSSNPRILICQVASKFEIVVGIHNLLASGTSCPLPWFLWVLGCILPLMTASAIALLVCC
jgi:hypothetical protein